MHIVLCIVFCEVLNWWNILIDCFPGERYSPVLIVRAVRPRHFGVELRSLHS